MVVSTLSSLGHMLLSQNPPILSELPIAQLNTDQLNKFTYDSLHVESSQDFNVHQAAQQISEQEGKKVLASDFGGDKGTVRLFEVKNGSLVPTEGYSDDIHGDNGSGYVDVLKKAISFAESNDVPFGISWGGPINSDGTLLYHPKATVFMEEMKHYGNDLYKLSPVVKAAINDGPAGLLYSAVEAYKANGSTSVLFAINGGGLGFAALFNDKVLATEGGHIQAVPELNKYNQNLSCGVYGSDYICLERIGANKAGIETQWEQHTGTYARARDIEDRYKERDALAFKLYEHSAFIMAHTIAGTAKALTMDLTAPKVTVACHGGAFKFPAYGERVRQLIESHLGQTIQFMMTKDIIEDNSNACLTGAAIAALTNN